jgi:hypothetical protein
MTTPINSAEYRFYFKMIYTEQFCYYSFDPDTTIKQFIDLVNFQAYETFNIVGDVDFEVVEAGKGGFNADGFYIEDEKVDKLDYLDTKTLREIYANNWQTTAFYLRCVPITSLVDRRL